MAFEIQDRVKVAIVILNWNGLKFLKQFFGTLVENSNITNYQVVVADNGSTDSSIEYLQQNYPKIRIIRLDKNYGFTGGYNRSLNQVDAEYFVLLNSDIEVTPHWIEPIIEFMDSNPEVAACQPKIRSFSQKEYFEYAGAAGGFIDKFGYPFCRGRILKEHEKDEGQYDQITEIFWATGACMFVRADLYKKAGGLDEDFFAHMEEIDLCWRLKNMGYKIFFHPDSVVYHVGGGTLPNNNPKKLFLNYRNNLFLLFKNLPSKQRFIIVYLRMILDGMSANLYFLKGSFSFFWAVLKAHIQFYLNLFKLTKKRKALENQFNNYKHQEIYQGSIVKAFFIKKVRKFSDLTNFPEKF